MTTRVAAAAYAGGLNKPVTAVKTVVSPKTLAQGVATPARKSSASVSAPIASSPAAYVAVTAETTPAHANNTADSARRRRLTVSVTVAPVAQCLPSFSSPTRGSQPPLSPGLATL